ncbi:endonuclease/exonuclease/phosphatase family protein [Aspergillus lucknowensis]|uniref:Endonuclease/exonuclease/phosphatase family protein n=1 Tax=Aspergillus lucknowensis TaxID=176173 RepID=A0ABR4LIV2_9EURO
MKSATTGIPLRILTHNIRYATSSPFKGERPWEERAPRLLQELFYNTCNQDAFICLQEVLHNQLIDVLSGLNSRESTTPDSEPEDTNRSWAYIGVGRDDGYKAGEYSPIFYRPSTWELRHWETVWLSETPDIPSKGWDAASIRIVTIGVFTHHISRRTVLAMSTHLDDQGSRSRFEAAHIILRKIDEYRNGPFGKIISGIFLAGDLNSEETQEAYSVLTAPGSPLVDTANLVKSGDRYGNYTTWTGFGYEGQDPSRIDYIFLGAAARSASRALPWRVGGYAVLANRFDDGVFNSDHRAVVVDAILRS